MQSIVFVVLLLFTISMAYGNECEIFLRHVDEYGIGVYAGRYFERNRPIEVAIGVPIPIPVVLHTELINYMEGINDTHGVLLLGHSSMFNHVPIRDALIRKHLSFHESKMVFPGGEESYDIVTEPISVVYAGNQIFSHYGDSWFQDRGLDEVVANTMSNANHIVHVTDLHNIEGLLPGCPSNLVKFENNRLVAAMNIFKGQVIEVDRALLIIVSETLKQSGPLASLVWYSYYGAPARTCEATEGECEDASAPVVDSSISPYVVESYSASNSYAVLLLGNGALYGSTTTATDSRVANVEYKWWSVDMIDKTAVDLDKAILTEAIKTYDERIGGESEEVKCSLKMLMSFTAIKDIQEGEELVVDVIERVVNGRIQKTMNEFVSINCV